MPPFKLYSKFAPVGVLTVIEPVGVLQVGCVEFVVGATGTTGAGLTVKVDEGETQPVILSLTVVV